MATVPAHPRGAGELGRVVAFVMNFLSSRHGTGTRTTMPFPDAEFGDPRPGGPCATVPGRVHPGTPARWAAPLRASPLWSHHPPNEPGGGRRPARRIERAIRENRWCYPPEEMGVGPGAARGHRRATKSPTAPRPRFTSARGHRCRAIRGPRPGPGRLGPRAPGGNAGSRHRGPATPDSSRRTR